ncbi:CLUMA_CG000909, isoform A [Clunio marinus]|uniref:CLUMA_CG000909, isoform A n=1 Tax=Clunio marinus TaxID=568069 RepID=A0A1J1HI14_9DIPT|nr:CLUMA_CG000909, isoform A [Clunio marinus]
MYLLTVLRESKSTTHQIDIKCDLSSLQHIHMTLLRWYLDLMAKWPKYLKDNPSKYRVNRKNFFFTVYHANGH